MNQDRFNLLVEEMLNHCYQILYRKGKEYKGGYEDRLSSFKRAAILQGCSTKSALTGMLAKHVVSIYDMCKAKKDFPMEVWEEKLTDAINYLLLLTAIIKEENADE